MGILCASPWFKFITFVYTYGEICLHNDAWPFYPAEPTELRASDANLKMRYAGNGRAKQQIPTYEQFSITQGKSL